MQNVYESDNPPKIYYGKFHWRWLRQVTTSRYGVTRRRGNSISFLIMTRQRAGILARLTRPLEDQLCHWRHVPLMYIKHVCEVLFFVWFWQFSKREMKARRLNVTSIRWSIRAGRLVIGSSPPSSPLLFLTCRLISPINITPLPNTQTKFLS